MRPTITSALRRIVHSFLPLLLAPPAGAQATADASPASVDLEWAVKVPMRDGVELNATIYRPHGASDPLPVIFELTPYISDSYHERAWYFAHHGYVFAIVDVRGRGNSRGSFTPFFQEPRDGHDVVEWLAKQPWCDGKVAMWGGSYAGFDQWLTLREAPRGLATIVPAAAAHIGVDFPAYKNVFPSYVIQWLTYTSGVTGNGKLFGESAFWRDRFGEMYRDHRPFRELDRIAGNTTTVFQEWLAHPEVDAYQRQLELSPDQYRRIDVPILTITGSYDDDQPGALTYYRRHMESGSDAAKARHFLVVGPWDHAGTRTPTLEVGGVKFAEASKLDLNDLHRQWYDWTLKAGERPAFLKKRVTCYVMGAEEWRWADTLEELTPRRTTLHLDSTGGAAGDAFHSGRLSESPPASASASKPDEYVYDPLDLRPGAREEVEVPAYLTDQRDVLTLAGDGLVYTGEPFAADTEVTGFVRLVLWIELDVPDSDFAVTLSEVLPDGSSVRLTTDLMRARYRESLATPKLVQPGAIEKYEFTGFTFFSRRLARGSRLRLLITSPNTRFLQKNYNSGGVVSDETAKDARTAHVRIHHDAKHESILDLPLGR